MSKKLAVLISNSHYELPDFDLGTPANDIAAIERSILSRGFTVQKHQNVDADTFESIFSELSSETSYDFIFIYYAGHAIEINGQGYLLPVNLLGFAPYVVASYTFCINKIFKALNNISAIKIIVLDSCRNGVPGWREQEFSDFANYVGHESDIMNYQNVAIAYSTSSGDVAYDGEGMSHYAKHFSEQMLRHRTSIDEVFKNVGALVSKTPPHNQRPWYYSSLNESLTFSDLPDYHYIHTLRVPLSGLATCLECLNGLQVIYGGDKNAYGLNGTEHKRILEFHENILGLDYSDSTGYVLAANDGGVLSEMFKYSVIYDSNYFVRIRINSSGTVVAIILSQEIMFLNNLTKKLTRNASENEIYYSALFINDTMLWVGTTTGVKVVTITNKSVLVKDLPLEGALYVYCIERVDECTIALSCSGGMILFVNDLTFTVVGKTCLGKTAQTVSARRDSIINIVSDNDVVNNFIYKPWLIEDEDINVLKKNLAGNDIIFVKASPIDPILIAASDEGVVYFIDVRNYSMYYSINVCNGDHKINGISFEKDGTMLILTDDGNVRYYSRGEADFQQAIRYIDDMRFTGRKLVDDA